MTEILPETQLNKFLLAPEQSIPIVQLKHQLDEHSIGESNRSRAAFIGGKLQPKAPIKVKSMLIEVPLMQPVQLNINPHEKQ